MIDAVDKCRDARVAEIRATKTDVKISGKCYYVSADGNDVTIDNICMKYTGSYGIVYDNGLHGGVKGRTVQNCEFGWIGGGVHQADGWLTRAGNAIEIYGACKNFTVKNCYIYHIYDTGITHQY